MSRTTRGFVRPRFILLLLSDSLTYLLGLIDEGESPEETAIRELEEETGFKASSVIQTSPLLVCDPGPHSGSPDFQPCTDPQVGMTNANMRLVTVDVPFPEKLEMPAQKLDPGEYITARIVELSKLAAEFKGLSCNYPQVRCSNTYTTSQSTNKRSVRCVLRLSASSPPAFSGFCD